MLIKPCLLHQHAEALIDDIPTVADLVSRIVADAEQVIGRLVRLCH
jgi:hypothetical protein